jgi:hypothetical protein
LVRKAYLGETAGDIHAFGCEGEFSNRTSDDVGIQYRASGVDFAKIAARCGARIGGCEP